MSANPHPIPYLNTSVWLHPREQLRRFKAVRGFSPGAVVTPTPPATLDLTKSGTLTFPILGNDRYGDCEYAAGCHASQTFTGNATVEDAFNTAEVVKYYLALAGGDNGLNTDVMMGEWGRGLCGGPHKIFDSMDVTATDQKNMKLAMWLFGGIFFTLALPDLWLANPMPGDLWDAGPGVIANPRNGHAIWLNGFGTAGYTVQTWGMSPPIRISFAGVSVCDAEASVVFSPDWFNPSTGLAPNGYSYDTLAGLWMQFGGHSLPPNPFSPTPAPPPTPPAPSPPLPPLPPPNPPAPTPPGPPPTPLPVNLGLLSLLASWEGYKLVAGSDPKAVASLLKK